MSDKPKGLTIDQVDKLHAYLERPVMNPQALIAQAIDKGAPVETMERMVALAERMMAWQARKAYNAAIAEFQLRCPVIKKSSHAGGDRFEFDYAALEDIAPEIKPILGELGLSYSWITVKPSGPNMVAVTCRISHREGHYEESPHPTEMPYRLDGRMNAAQSVRSATTYARRTSLEGMLGIVAEGEDDDARDTDAAHERIRREFDRDAAAAKFDGDFKLEPEPPVQPSGPKLPDDPDHAAAVTKLMDRWRALAFTGEQVRKILAAHGLPETLAKARSDWSKVDRSVIDEMVKASR